MKKIFAFALCAALTAALSACGGNSSGSSGTASTASKTESAASKAESTTSKAESAASKAESVASKTESSSVEVPEELAFLADDEVYFDIQLSGDSVKDFEILVNGKPLGDSKKVSLKDQPKLEVKGEIKDGSKVYYGFMRYVIKGSSFGKSQTFKTLDEDLTTQINKNFSSFREGRVYVVITDKPDGWDQNLSPALNTFIKSNASWARKAK